MTICICPIRIWWRCRDTQTCGWCSCGTRKGRCWQLRRVVSGEERRRNLETLQFIAAETAARGLHFQLGIWTHAYAWTDSPNAYHRIEGLTPETHAAYCRDALAILLKKCPEIQGLTMRVHGESGIPEGRLRLLADAVRGDQGLRAHGRDRHARQGRGRNDDRHRDGDGDAGEAGGEIFGGASEPGVSAGGHPRAGDSQGECAGERAVQLKRRLALVHAIRICGLSGRGSAVQAVVSIVAGDAAASAVVRLRRWRRRMGGRRIFAERRDWN